MVARLPYPLGWANNQAGIAVVELFHESQSLVALMSAETFAAGFVAVCGGIGIGIPLALGKAGPPVIAFIGEWRKMRNATDARVAENTAKITAIEQQNELIKQQNDELKRKTEAVERMASSLGNKVRGLQQDGADMGEAGLINIGDMQDPIRSKATP